MDASCDQALQITTTKLSRAGLWTVQTFNLNTARLGSNQCSCPNHDNEACDCQMIVLLVYGESAEPATLLLHGNGGKTWISFADDALHRLEKSLTTRIQEILESPLMADTSAN